MKMNRTNTAGRILVLLLTALLVLSLAACGAKGGDQEWTIRCVGEFAPE